jgi:hypothetical protein
MDTRDLENRFKFHPAIAPQTKQNHADVREACLDLAYLLNKLVPEGREKSLSITHLEEVMMWANAGIARQD